MTAGVTREYQPTDELWTAEEVTPALNPSKKVLSPGTRGTGSTAWETWAGATPAAAVACAYKWRHDAGRHRIQSVQRQGNDNRQTSTVPFYSWLNIRCANLGFRDVSGSSSWLILSGVCSPACSRPGAFIPRVFSDNNHLRSVAAPSRLPQRDLPCR